jgi:hypothetical protein
MKRVAKIAHSFPYTSDLDYVTLEDYRLLLGRSLLVAEYTRAPTRWVTIAVQVFNIRQKDLSSLLS